MLYLKCPTCKNILGNKELPFEEEKAKIREDKNMTPDQKEDALSNLPTKFGLDRYCCRMRLITYTNQIDIVK